MNDNGDEYYEEYKASQALLEQDKTNLYNFEEITSKNIDKLPSYFGAHENFVEDKFQAAAAFLNYFEKEVTIKDRNSSEFIKRKANIYRDQIRYLEQRDIKLLDIDYQDFMDWISLYKGKMIDLCEQYGFQSPTLDISKLTLQDQNDLNILMFCQMLREKLQGIEAEEFQAVMRKGALMVFQQVVDRDFFVDLPIARKKKENQIHNPDPERTRLMNKLHIGLVNYPEERDIHDIEDEMLGKLVTVKGDLDSYDDHNRFEIITSQWECDNCGFKSRVYGDKPPSKCPNGECGSKNCFRDLEIYTTNVYVYMKISQHINSEDTLIGMSDIVVKVEGANLIKNFWKKSRQSATLKVVGIVKLSPEKNNKANSKEHVAQIQALSIDVEGESTTVQFNDKLMDIIATQVKPECIDQHYAKLKASICPHLYELEAIKEAVLLMLTGAVARLDPHTKRRIRGDLVMLLAGDPSLGKSEFGTFITKVNPYAIRTVGGSKTTTAAALTSSWEIIKDVRVISKGVLPRCDKKGIAIIDELDKRDTQDMQVLAIPLDDNQIIPTHKSNYHHDIPARCPVLLIGNASTNNGRWDKSKDINSQTNYGEYLLSRSDLIFILTDDGNIERKAKQVEHMAKSRSGMMAEEDFNKSQKHKILSDLQIDKIERDLKANKYDGHYSTEYLRHEFQFLKNTYKPMIKPGSEVEALLKKEYLKFSQIPMIKSETDEESGNMSKSVMDARAYNGLERIAMSIARAMRHHTVTLEDMQKAVHLMFSSLMSMMIQPKPETDKLKGERSVTKQLQRLLNNSDAIQGFVKAADMQEQKDRERYIREYGAHFRLMNRILVDLAFDPCPDCHGRKSISVESAVGHTTEPCNTCNGRGDFWKEFSRISLELELDKAKKFGRIERDKMINLYKDNGEIIPGKSRGNLGLKLKTRDNVYLADISEAYSMIAAEMRLKEDKVNRQRKLQEPRRQ